jgi:hypothetical protein
MVREAGVTAGVIQNQYFAHALAAQHLQRVAKRSQISLCRMNQGVNGAL